MKTALPLRSQCQQVISEFIPSPEPMLAAIDRHTPLLLKQLMTETPLNKLFASAIADGEFDDFEGRTLRLEIDGGQPGITLGFWRGRLRIVEGPGEATIRGSWNAFYQLAGRTLDPDQLFFQRKLVIEGETELGLGIKNLLDSVEWQIGLDLLGVKRFPGRLFCSQLTLLRSRHAYPEGSRERHPHHP